MPWFSHTRPPERQPKKPSNESLKHANKNAKINNLRAEGDFINVDIKTASSENFKTLSTKILNECVNGVQCSEEKHQLNRRSEFIIIE